MRKISGHFSGTMEISSNNEIAERKSSRANKHMMKALRMSLIHVLAFVFSWTPYTVIATWSVFHPISERNTSRNMLRPGNFCLRNYLIRSIVN